MNDQNDTTDIMIPESADTHVEQLKDPWLVAVWPGMGGVAVGAGGYLVNTLDATLEAKLAEQDYFDIDHVEVSKGIISRGRLPRSMFFVWKDPDEQHDLIFFVGESQPSKGGYALCHRVLDFAAKHGVKRVFTFAAMATQLHPSEDPRVFGAVTSHQLLPEISSHGVELLTEGQIGGLNGALLGAAEERGMQGVCLLGEMPFFAASIPNPKSTLAVLRVFNEMAGITVDLTPVAEQAEKMEPKMLELLERLSAQGEAEEPEPWAESLNEPVEEKDEPQLDLAARERIEHLFQKAREDKDKAMDLKKELDRLGVFDQYEDRFLDLFRRAA